MPYQPTQKELAAAHVKEEAVTLLKIAIEKLDKAAGELMDEEKLHSAISPTNQGEIVRCQEATNEIDELLERLTGERRTAVIECQAAVKRASSLRN